MYALSPRLVRPANTYDLVKSVAVLTMVVDHIGLYLFPDQMWLRVLGRMAFPLFLFLVGYSGHTRTDGRLLVGAGIVSALDYGYTGSVFPLNILWVIALTRWILGRWGYEQVLLQTLVLLLGWVVAVPYVAYGTSALLFGALGAWARQQGEKSTPRFIISVWVLVGLHTATQLRGFPFDTAQKIGILGVGAWVGFTLHRFTVRPVRLPAVLLWVSRYALELYVLHLVVLMLCAAMGQGRGL